MSIKGLEGLFQGETLFVIGDFLPNPADYNLSRLKEKITLGLDRSVLAFPSPTFWCSDNFQSEYKDISPCLKKSKETRIFSPLKSTTDEKFIWYNPIPLWAFPEETRNNWIESEKNDDCPIGWGSFCLAIGIAYRLGFRRVVGVGCFPDDQKLRLDMNSKSYIEDQKLSLHQYDLVRNTARNTSLILGVEVEVEGETK